MSQDRFVEAAKVMLQLGIASDAVTRILSNHDIDVIERQIYYLPYRNAKRPGAFLIEAIRSNYSTPKELYYAKNEAVAESWSLDESAERLAGLASAETQGHRTEADPGDA